MMQIFLDKRMKRSYLMQVTDQLKNYHVQNALEDGSLFPDYEAVAVANKLDTLMVKTAYETLVKDGYLTRKNKRYYIKRIPFVETYVGHFNNIYGAITKLGMTPSFKTLTVEIKPELPAIFEAEEATQKKRYVRLVKVFYADAIPLIHSEAYYALSLFPDFTSLDLSEMRIFPYLEKTHGITFAHYRQVIDVVTPGEAINEALNQPPNASVFRMQMKVMDKDNQPFEYATLHTSILYSLESINRLR